MSLLNQNLQAFMAIVSEGTVVQAAQTLGLTQTAVTQRIRALERELEVTLFIRSRQGMKPTEQAMSLIHYCKRAQELEGETFASLYGDQSEQRVVMSGASSIMRSRVIPRTFNVVRKYPFLKLSYDLTDTSSSLSKLKKGECDFSLIAREDVVLEVDSLLLKPERYILVGPSKWKGRKLKEVIQSESIIDFDHNDMMTFNFLRKYDLLSESLASRHFANNTDALASFVAGGLGYSVLTQEFAEPFIRSKKLINLAPKKFYDYEVALCWYPRAQMPKYFQYIVDSLRK